MSSRFAIVLLCFFLATVILVSSEVAARDLAETSDNVDTSKETSVDIDDGGHYHEGRGGRGNYGGGGRGSHGGGRGNYGGGGHGGGNYCRHGCCSRNFRYQKGSCGRCCSYAGEKAT